MQIDGMQRKSIVGKKEELFLSLADHMLDGVVIVDWNGIILYANKAASRIVGVDSPADGVGLNMIDFIHPDSRNFVINDLQLIKEGKRGFQADYRLYKLITRQGEIRWVEGIGTKVNYNGNTADLVTLRDITKRKRTEEALEASKEQYRSMINAMGDAIIVVDKNLKIILINEACIQTCHRFGLDSDIIGKYIFDAFPFLTEKTREEFLQVLDSGIVLVTEEEHNINGSKIINDIRMIPVFENDEVMRIMIVAKDITARKEAELLLKESEERYRTLMEEAPIGLCNIDTKGIIQYVNKGFEEINGYTPDEMVGKNSLELDIFDSETLERLAKRLEERLKGDASRPFEAKIQCKDGAWKWIEMTASTNEKDGKIAGFQIAARDISDRKEAEEKLKKSEEDYRLLFNNAADLIVVTDKQGIFLDLNDKFEEESGYTREEMLGKNVFTSGLLTAESTTKLLNYLPHLSLLLTNKQSPIFEVEGVTKTRRIIPYELRTVPITKNGKIVSIQTILRNINERKKAELALKESEQKFRELAELLPETIYETDLCGLITFVNRNGFEKFKYTQEDFEKGINVSQLIAPADRNRAAENRMKVLNGENIGLNEYTALTKDGGTFPIMIHSSPILRSEKLAGVRGFVVDITEQRKAEEEKKRLEAQLQRARKMEALGTLAGGVAHDLNNVLGGLVTYPELLLMQLPEDSPLRKSITVIKKSGEKAAAIVQDLLTLARRGVSSREDIDLNRIIYDHLKTPEHERLLDFHPDIEIETRFQDYLLNIKGSPFHLSKTIMNLLSNAAEAMPDGGKIIISTENRYIDRPIGGYDNVDEGDYVVLTVTDTGIGISSKDLEQIFEPFYTKKVMGRSGTGLGMAVVWGTVKDHRGYIDIESIEDKGTTITLYFPVKDKRLTRDKKLRRINNYQGKGETILIVDDVREQREIAIHLLEKLGYKPIAVASGEEAVKYVNKHPVDLVMLDMIMDPGIDGLETYERMIEIYPGQKAIIVSGFSETRRVKKLQKLGAGEYVKKPYLMENIGKAIRKELDKKSYEVESDHHSL